MPKIQITLSTLAHAQLIFSSLIYSLLLSPFFCSWALTVLYFSRKRSQNSSEFREVHFKAFQWACETRVSLEYFLVKVSLFVANFLVHVSLNGMGWVWFCKDLVPLHKLSVKVDNDNPRSQSSLSCFKKERFSLGARERTLETRLDNDR